MGKKKVLKKSKKHLETPEDDDSWTTEIKHRRRFSFDELQLLESFFYNNPCPTQDNIQDIAHQLKAPRKNITTWFQNRRAKNKRKEKDLMSQNAQLNYPWFDPSFSMNPFMQQQEQLLFQPYNVKNTCWYYAPRLCVNPNDLMLDHPSSSSSLSNNNELEEQMASNQEYDMYYFPMSSNTNN